MRPGVEQAKVNAISSYEFISIPYGLFWNSSKNEGNSSTMTRICFQTESEMLAIPKGHPLL